MEPGPGAVPIKKSITQGSGTVGGRLHSTLTLPRLRESWARAYGGAERSGASGSLEAHAAQAAAAPRPQSSFTLVEGQGGALLCGQFERLAGPAVVM